MPKSLKPWFSGAALYQFVALAFSLALSVLGLASMINGWEFWALVAMAFLVSLFGWRQAAHQTIEQQAEVARLHGKLDPLVANISELAARNSDEENSFADLTKLSNRKLRDLSLHLASELRAFEVGYQQREDQHTNRSFFSSTQDPTLRNAKRDKERVEERDRRSAYTAAFKTRYLANAIAIRNELCARLGLPIPKSMVQENYLTALHDAMLTGPSPLNEVATVIESLARTLR